MIVGLVSAVFAMIALCVFTGPSMGLSFYESVLLGVANILLAVVGGVIAALLSGR